jgi:hypothetical protein
MHLYELSAIYAHLQSELEDGEPDAIDRAIAKIDAIEGAFNDKAVQVAFVLKNMQAMADAIGEEAERMTARKKAADAKIASIKEYLRTNMVRASVSKIECPHFKIALRDNPPKVNVVDEKAIPIEYMVQAPVPPPAPDKKKIIEDWKQGVVVEGVEITQGSRIEIR